MYVVRYMDMSHRITEIKRGLLGFVSRKKATERREKLRGESREWDKGWGIWVF